MGGMRVGLVVVQKGEDICIHTADSRCCTAETNTTLWSNYTPIKKKMWHPCFSLSRVMRESGMCSFSINIGWRFINKTFEQQYYSLLILILKKGMATHSSILAWRIPWTEVPGGLQSMGLQRVGHDWSNLARMQSLFST